MIINGNHPDCRVVERIRHHQDLIIFHAVLQVFFIVIYVFRHAITTKLPQLSESILLFSTILTHPTEITCKSGKFMKNVSVKTEKKMFIMVDFSLKPLYTKFVPRECEPYLQ